MNIKIIPQYFFNALCNENYVSYGLIINGKPVKVFYSKKSVEDFLEDYGRQTGL